jgi:hypothetical protein
MRTSISTHGRQQPLGQLDRFCAVAGLADDFDLVLGVEDHPEAVADQRLVVAEQDADRHCCATGSRGADAEASAVVGARLELTAERRDAFAHPDQAAPVAAARGQWRRPVVEDIDAHGLGVEAERHRRVLRRGVTQCVRERLLDDPVRGRLQRRWQLSLLAHNLELDLEAGRPHLLEQRLHPPEGRLGRQRRGLAARPGPQQRSRARARRPIRLGASEPARLRPDDHSRRARYSLFSPAASCDRMNSRH